MAVELGANDAKTIKTDSIVTAAWSAGSVNTGKIETSTLCQVNGEK